MTVSHCLNASTTTTTTTTQMYVNCWMLPCHINRTFLPVHENQCFTVALMLSAYTPPHRDVVQQCLLVPFCAYMCLCIQLCGSSFKPMDTYSTCFARIRSNFALNSSTQAIGHVCSGCFCFSHVHTYTLTHSQTYPMSVNHCVLVMLD